MKGDIAYSNTQKEITYASIKRTQKAVEGIVESVWLDGKGMRLRPGTPLSSIVIRNTEGHRSEMPFPKKFSQSEIKALEGSNVLYRSRFDSIDLSGGEVGGYLRIYSYHLKVVDGPSRDWEVRESFVMPPENIRLI